MNQPESFPASIPVRLRQDADLETSRSDGNPQGRPLRKQPLKQGVTLLGVASLLWVGAACSGGSGGAQGSSTNQVGTYGSTGSGDRYFTDNNEQGQSNSLRIENMFWGRLVDIYALNAAGERRLMHTDMVIGKAVATDGLDYELSTNPVTAIQELTILRNVEDTSLQGGFDQYVALLRRTQQSLDPITQQGPGSAQGGSAGLFSMVPRNAAIVLEFNDLLDPDSITNQTVRTLTGTDFAGVFESRVIGDSNYGDLADLDGQPGLEFYTTRVIVDPTISIIESFDFNPPVPVNSAGLPPSTSVNLSNLLLRIPTRNQPNLLQNPSGHVLSVTANLSYDAGRPEQPVHRAMRSGGNTEVTGDSFNGFLLDNEAPVVIGSNLGQIVDPPVQINGGLEFLVPNFRFDSVFCAKLPVQGDVIAQADRGVFADVISAQALNGNEVVNLRVRLRQYPVLWDEPGQAGAATWITAGLGSAEYQAAYDPVFDLARVPCFVRINPLPSGYPDFPAAGVDPNSTFELRFSEPMDPASVTAFDSLLLTRQEMAPDNDPPLATSDFVVGNVTLAPDFQRFTFTPDVDLAHTQGNTEEYYLTLLDGELGATDLAGNQVAGNFPAIPFQIDSGAASVATGGRVSRFSDVDEELEVPYPADPNDPQDFGTHPEWAGQHLIDLNRQLIYPRPVTRYTAVADRTQTVPALMTPFSVGIQTPLSNLGSKTQILYRFMDFGWTLTDSNTANVDVTGVAWAPVNGLVNFDAYSDFEIRMSHCRYAPDELIDPATLWPQYPNSGLVGVFASNLLDGTNDPQRIVHPRAKGYVIQPGSAFTVPGGLTKFVPYPMNEDTPDDFSDDLTYTWRNTALLNRAGPSNGGSPPDVQMTALGLDPGVDYFIQNQIRTIGLPLLIEFRCYPDGNASGLNGFDINLAANSSSRPYMRAFSTGGIDSSNTTQTVNPDVEISASGGYSPAQNGASTYGRDNSFYLGALDIVIRVSRSVSVWFPAYNPNNPGQTFLNPTYSDPVLEPRPDDQPLGTSIDVDFRGALSITLHPEGSQLFGNLLDETVDPAVPVRHFGLVNATKLDIYGDHYGDDPSMPQARHNPARSNMNISDLQGNNRLVDEDWRDTISEINGARFYQLRLTFRSNIVSNDTPTLSAIAVSWQQ